VLVERCSSLPGALASGFFFAAASASFACGEAASSPAVPTCTSRGSAAPAQHCQLRSASAQVHRALSRFFGRLRAIGQALALATQIAETIRLKSIGENTKQQVARQVRRWSLAKDTMPAVPQFTDIESAQTRDLDRECLPVRHSRTDLDPRHD